MAAEAFAVFEGLRMGEDKKKDGLPVEEFWVPANIGEPEPIKTVEIPRDKFITESIIRHSMMFAIQRLEKDNARLEVERDFAAKLAMGRTAEQPSPTVAPEPPKPSGEPWKSLLDAYKAYARLSDKTWKSYDQAFRRLEKAAGDKPIDAVSPEDIRAFRELVVAETKPRGGRKTTAAGTLQKQLSHIKSFFQWAKAEKGFIQSNPAEDITVPPSIRKDGAAITRNPYSKEELQAIFTAPNFVGCKSVSRRFDRGNVVVRDGKFWLPLLALFAGGRLMELATLATKDIVFSEGHDCVSINLIPDEEDKDDPTLKTAAAVRIIPIHPTLKKLGFMEFVAEARRKRRVRLFEDFDYGKWWNQQFLGKIGLKRPDLTFHSFRHTFKRGLRGIQSDETKNRLMGHAPANVGEGYGGGVSEQEARLFCEVFEVPISLSHLYPLPKAIR